MAEEFLSIFEITFLQINEYCICECLAIEINLHKKKWQLIFSYSLHKSNISKHFINLSKIIDKNSSCYDKYLCIIDFHSELSEKLKNVVREPAFLKNLGNPSWIDLFLTNCSRSLQNTKVIETGLLHF